MTIFQAAVLLVMSCGAAVAQDGKIVVERASTTLPIVRPAGPSVFENSLRSMEQKADNQIDRKEIDGEIQAWFDRQKTDNTEFYQQRKETWDALIAETKQAARPVLEAVEAKWRAAVGEAVKEFQASEKAFYDGNPVAILKATYRYREGRRDPSDPKNGWRDEVAMEFANTPEIRGSITFDSGEVAIRVSGEQEPIVKVRQAWSVSLNANLEKCNPGARVPWELNRPKSEVACELQFEGELLSSEKLSRTRRDGKRYPLREGEPFVGLWIGDSTLGLGVGVGSKFNLTACNLRGPIEAGKDLTVSAERLTPPSR